MGEQVPDNVALSHEQTPKGIPQEYRTSAQKQLTSEILHLTAERFRKNILSELSVEWKQATSIAKLLIVIGPPDA